MVYCFVLNSHKLESLGNSVVKWGFGEWRYLLFLNSSREVACPDLKEQPCESITKVLILRCKNPKFIYAWNGSREISWTKEEEILGSRYECCVTVAVGSCGSVQMWIISSNPTAGWPCTPLCWAVFAIRCASGSGVCRLEGPRCWAQAGMSIESCQSLCVLHLSSCTRTHFVLFLAVLPHLFTGS